MLSSAFEGSGVSGLGFRVQGLGVEGFGFRVSGFINTRLFGV